MDNTTVYEWQEQSKRPPRYGTAELLLPVRGGRSKVIAGDNFVRVTKGRVDKASQDPLEIRRETDFGDLFIPGTRFTHDFLRHVLSSPNFVNGVLLPEHATRMVYAVMGYYWLSEKPPKQV